MPCLRDEGAGWGINEDRKLFIAESVDIRRAIDILDDSRFSEIIQRAAAIESDRIQVGDGQGLEDCLGREEGLLPDVVLIIQFRRVAINGGLQARDEVIFRSHGQRG